MLIKRKRGWELGENQATPEGCYLKRGELVRAMGLGAAAKAATPASVARRFNFTEIPPLASTAGAPVVARAGAARQRQAAR